MVLPPETAVNARSRGFTLIELLVVMVIGLVLITILLPVIAGGRTMARMAREQSSGRSLMIGVFNYAEDHEGEIIHGFCTDPNHPGDLSALPIKPETPGERPRYPLRLIQYIGDYDKRIIVADSKNWYESLSETSPYFISLYPSFGMNTFFVGGDESGNDASGVKPIERHFNTYGKFCLTRIGEAAMPSRQIVFVSARGSGGDGVHYAGYFKVIAPNTIGTKWSSQPFSESANAADHGHVDFRYKKKAVVAHLDGHVEMLDEAQLRDMRRWSNQAAMANDPNFSL